MLVGYVRVSTVQQNEARQLEIMEMYKVEKIFLEKQTAKNTDRQRLNEMLNFIREGDSVVVHSLDRLARNTADLLSLVERLESKGVTLLSYKENIDTKSATGKLLLTVIAAIAQFERENLRERQAEGIALAKQRGVYKGRQPVKLADIETHYNRWRNRQINKSQLAQELKISRQTLHRLFTEYESKSSAVVA